MPPAWSKEQLNIWGFVLGAISIIQDYIKQVVVNDGVPENLKKGEEEAADEEGGKGQEREGGDEGSEVVVVGLVFHQGGEGGGEGQAGITADKDIPSITSAKGVITIDNDLWWCG